jgi:hypothetical protein
MYLSFVTPCSFSYSEGSLGSMDSIFSNRSMRCCTLSTSDSRYVLRESREAREMFRTQQKHLMKVEIKGQKPSTTHMPVIHAHIKSQSVNHSGKHVSHREPSLQSMTCGEVNPCSRLLSCMYDTPSSTVTPPNSGTNGAMT